MHDSLIVPLKYVPECRKAMNVAFKERFGQDIPITGWLLEGLLDALDRPAAEKRNPEFLALCHQMAYDLADTGEYLFLDNREIYQAVKQLLVDYPPGSDGPDGTYAIKADDEISNR